MKKKRIILYVEGPTEEEFYNRLKDNIRNKIPDKKFKVDGLDIFCVKGIANFSNKLLAKFKKEIIENYPNDEIIVFLCYDNDVFEYGVYPPVNRKKLEKDLYAAGADRVFHLVAKRTIEDWFMFDVQGILKYLRLNKKTKVNGQNGLDKINYLFKCANRVYQKGSNVEGLIKNLNINKICLHICPEISDLCIEVGIVCSKSCKKS